MKIIARYIDNQYEDHGYDHVRKIVRAILYNDKGEICLIHVYGDDIFGHRDVLETPGGGVKSHERLIDALKRELLEELGAEINNVREIGRVIDFYNLIKRKNDNHYYLAHLKSISDTHQSDFEKSFFKEIIWDDIDNMLQKIDNLPNYPWKILVSQREKPIIYRAKEMLKKEGFIK